MANRIVETELAILELAEECIPGLTELFPNPEALLDGQIYQRYCDPRKLAHVSPETLKRELQHKMGKQPVDAVKISSPVALAQEALKFHRFAAVDLDDIQTQIREEMAILAALALRQKRLRRKNHALYQKLDPQGLTMSIPGQVQGLAPGVPCAHAHRREDEYLKTASLLRRLCATG